MTASTGPEGDGDPRDVATIMVVCTANICRSPLAAAMLEAEARSRIGQDPPVHVTSSGVHALEGHRAASGTLVVADHRGLDLRAHRGAATSRAAVDASDLVLTMTSAHRAAVNSRAPGSSGRVFTLREFARLVAALKPLDDDLAPPDRIRFLVRLAHGARAYVARPSEPEDVVDPYGGPEEGYGAMAEEVEALIAAIAPQLFGRTGPQG